MYDINMGNKFDQFLNIFCFQTIETLCDLFNYCLRDDATPSKILIIG